MELRELKHMPKIELHCHLDGSVRPETALEIGVRLGILSESTTLNQVRHLLMAPTDCDSLDTYLKTFDLPIAIMQTVDVIERIAFELFEDAAIESVRYLEVRFAPFLHNRQGLNLDQVIKAAISGMRRAEQKYPVKGNWILSHLRHHSAQSMLELVDAGFSYLGRGVVAMDLAGSEKKGYARDFVEPVAYAREKGYRVTMHAGETGYAENVRDAIALLGATRVGHGCAIVNDDLVADIVLRERVTIEACPTSNIQTRIVDKPANHPIKVFYEQGMVVMVNTDNRTVSNTDMTREFELLREHLNWDFAAFEKVYHNAIEGAFCDESTKKWLKYQWNAYIG